MYYLILFLSIVRFPKTLLSTFLIFTSLTTYAVCEKDEFVHGWGGDWKPFVMGTPEEPSGLDMDILDAVIKEAGCRWRNTNYAIPWARHLKFIESGAVDLATSASWTTDRAKYAHFTKPYRTEHVAIYVLQESMERFSDLTLEELSRSDFKLGAVRGEVYGKVMGDFVNSLGSKVYPLQNNTQNLQKLIHKRIDGYIGHIPHDSIILNEKEPEKAVVILPNSVTPTGNVHIMMSKKSTASEDLEALNQAISRLEANGTIDAIKEKYSNQFKVPLY